jgi:hypothetical protein
VFHSALGKNAGGDDLLERISTDNTTGIVRNKVSDDWYFG